MQPITVKYTNCYPHDFYIIFFVVPYKNNIFINVLFDDLFFVYFTS